MSHPDAVPEAGLRCSFAAAHRGDPMTATASPAAGFLLVEQQGPWGRRAFTESRLDPEIGAALSARAVVAGLRPLLIRRPGRGDAAEDGARRWAVVDARPGRSVTRWGAVAAAADLLDLPLDHTAGEISAEPAYLVCTHGRHDACCAIRGRPVAAALGELRPGQVWECSHVGGDRFAANVIALPHGLYYGRVDVDRAEDLVRAHERGEVLLDLLRGRSSWTAAVQAAQDHLRSRSGELAIEAHAALSATEIAPGRWRVRLRGAGTKDGALELDVRSEPAGSAAFLTCGATAAATPRTFSVTGFRPAS